VTSLFADVVGSTALGERLSPAEVKALIGECVSRMCEAIEGFGGVVRSYMGDGVAGFFGIDTTREDDSERAARAALEIRDLAARYSVEVEATWGVTDFNVRVGIQAGRVAVGSVGAADPQRVALGDSVNTAARLQSAAEPGSILVGAPVAAAIGSRFVLRPVGELSVKGRTKNVEAYELSGEGSSATSRLGPSFIGRTDELAVLASALTDLQDGRGQVLFVSGEAGIGKTRLVDECSRRASSDVYWLTGYCDPMDQRLPFGPFVHALQGWLGVDEQGGSLQTRVRLFARGRAVMGARFDDVAPYLAGFLGMELPSKLDRRLDGLPFDALQHGLTEAYASWLRALAHETPVVLVLDNFESASESTVHLTELLLKVVESAPLLLVMTMRRGIRCPAQRLRARAVTDLAPRCLEVALPPLSSSESRAMVESLNADGELDEALVSVIVDRAEGNPLYLEELCSAVSAREGEPAEDERTDEMPGALESLLLSRIDALPSASRNVLQAAAILGRAFMKDVVGRMCSDTDVDAAVQELLRADVIRERGRRPATFVFRHGLVREAALSTLTPAAYRELHKRAAVALQQSPWFDVERDAETLAGYYLSSGDFVNAADSLERLADRLARLCRWNEAAGLLQRCEEQWRAARSWSAFVRVASKRADVSATIGETGEAIRIVESALALRETEPRHPELQLAKARYLAASGEEEQAARIVESLLADVQAEEVYAPLLVLRGELALHRDDLTTAEDCVVSLGQLSDQTSEVAFNAASLAAGVRVLRGELEDAETWALRAQLLAERHGLISHQLTARRHTALICLLKGSIAEAYALSKAVYEQCVALGLGVGRLEAALDFIHIAVLRGELAEGARVAGSVLEDSPSPLWDGMLKANFASVLSGIGAYDDAQAMASEALDAATELPSWARLSARLVFAICAMATDDSSGAARHLAIARSEASNDRDRVVVAGVAAELALLEGALDDARSNIDAALAIGLSDRAIQAYLMRLSYIALGRSRSADVVEPLLRMLDEARRMGLRIEEGRLLISLGEFATVRPEEYFDKAQDILTACGAGLALVDLARARDRITAGVSP
jgi:class 3 adenylate cyclase/tetratricopeptide (TPR) repeat protein